MEAILAELEAALGHKFRSQGLLVRALTHRSLAREREVLENAEEGGWKVVSLGAGDNERLEFLGDAVLNSVVTDILYNRYTDQSEGFLTNTRSKIVKRDSLNQLAQEIGLDKLVKVTKYVNAHTNNNIYGNALEALMGAIYLDYGYKQCKKFVEKRLIRSFINLDEIVENEVNFKSKLIEWSQKYKLESEFILVDDTLSKSNKHIFKTRLVIQGKTICEASGASKKVSQQLVSKIAYQQILSNPDFLNELTQETPEIIEPQENHLPVGDV